MTNDSIGSSQPAPKYDDTIHVINSYTHFGLGVLADIFSLNAHEMSSVIRTMHRQVIAQLSGVGVQYGELRGALTPQPKKSEIAFIFNSLKTGSDSYGHHISHAWLPALRDHGPEKTAISVGDVLGMPSEFVWQQFQKHLVGSKDFARISAELYFVVYFSNVSKNQLKEMDVAIRSHADSYLGYIDCTTWKPIKSGMLLPQVGLRVAKKMVTSMDDDGYSNQVGYPLEQYGFESVGIEEDLYHIMLDHKLDNGVPEWADADSSMALNVLGGSDRSASDVKIVISDARFDYLMSSHNKALELLGLLGLDKSYLIDAVKSKMNNQLIFNLRFKEGTKNGLPAPENDAVLFSTQLEFTDSDGAVKCFQAGIKFSPALHQGEIVTFF